MALECIRHRKKGEILAHHMHEPLEAIALQQEGDGSFGNIHTTAIAIQVRFFCSFIVLYNCAIDLSIPQGPDMKLYYVLVFTVIL